MYWNQCAGALCDPMCTLDLLGRRGVFRRLFGSVGVLVDLFDGSCLGFTDDGEGCTSSRRLSGFVAVKAGAGMAIGKFATVHAETL